MYNRIFVLKFPKENIDQPIICKFVKEYDVEFNILKADINMQQEGLMVLELIGHKTNVEDGLRYLKSVGVKVEKVAASIRRDALAVGSVLRADGGRREWVARRVHDGS